MMRSLGWRVRQLTLAAFVIALLVPVAAATAHADEGTCTSPQSFTFVVALPGNQIGTITTHECFTGSTSTGTFTITVNGQTIAAGTLVASHSGCNVNASFEGEIIVTGQEFTGSLTFSCGTGTTIVHVEDIGTVTATFICTVTGGVYGCAPTSVSFVPLSEGD